MEMPPKSFCALCLRERPLAGNFFGYNVGANTKIRQTMDQVLGFQFHLENFYLCKSCLKMLQLVDDFKSCCLEANSKLKQYGRGLTSNDKWFSLRTAQWIDNLRVTVVAHAGQIRDFGVAMSIIKAEPAEQPDFAREDDLQEIPEYIVEVEMEEPVVEESESEYLDFTQEMVTDMTDGETKIEEAEDDGIDFNTWMRSSDDADRSAPEIPQIEIVECSKCHRNFDSQQGMKMHFPQCKDTDANNLYKHKCTICSITFKYPALLKNHMNKHSGQAPYKCRKRCDKRFIGNVNRYIHELQCAKEPQQCPICNRELNSMRALKDHMISAHGEPKHVCGVCGMRFKKTAWLTNHQASVHPDTFNKVRTVPIGQGPLPSQTSKTVDQTSKPSFECDQCSKVFSHRPLMLYHMRRIHRQ